MTALTRLDAIIRAANIPIDGVSGTQGNSRVDFQSSATDAQKTQAQSLVAAFDWSSAADATADAKAAKTLAIDAINNGANQNADGSRRLFLAVVQMVQDEFNNHTTWNTALTTAIAQATSLANLQTRVAAITAIPQRTEAQLKTAIANKINATAE